MASGLKPVEDEIEEQICDDGELHKDVAKSVLVFVGVNDYQIEESMDENSYFIKKHAIGVEKVYIPKGWKGNACIKHLELHPYLQRIFFIYITITFI